VAIELLAHRGASAEVRENTLAAFARALELGATCIETDAHVTRCGAVVLSHDADGARIAGDFRRVDALALQHVRAWGVPTLDEALARFPGARFNVDCKSRGERAVDALVRVIAARGAEDRVLVTSFDAGTLRRVRRSGYRGRTGLAQAEIARLYFTPLGVLRALPLRGVAAQIPTASMGLHLDTRMFLDKAHALGLAVHYWVINDPVEAARLLDLGADGIVTDDVRAIAPVVAAAAPRRGLTGKDARR
jgi:glycerophosphoryl diester phosphodiesterase